jgi:hypothetical protein
MSLSFFLPLPHHPVFLLAGRTERIELLELRQQLLFGSRYTGEKKGRENIKQ